MPLLEFRGKPSDNGLVTSSRPCGEGITALGFGYSILVFNSCQDSLEHFMIRTCRSHSQLPHSSFGFCQPRLYPSYHCHHLHIIVHVSLIHVPLGVPFSPDSHLSVVMSSFLLSALQRSTSHSYILLSSSSWFDAYYIIPHPHSC